MNIFLMIIFLIPHLSFAAIGNDQGNGGNVVVCEDAQGKVVRAELLDLFEGRVLYNFNYTEDQTSALVQALKYADKLSYAGSPVSAKNISYDIKDIYKNMHFLPKGVGLEPIPDSNHFIIPKGCRVAQTVNYKDWKRIYVDSDIWNVLSETQKAALLLHEAIYAYYREGNFQIKSESDSTRARYTVASIFAGSKFESVDKIVNNSQKTYLHCSSEMPYSEFFVYKNVESKYIAQFRYYFNRVVLTRSFIESNEAQIFSDELQSAFETGERLQVSFETETTGSIYDLSATESRSTKFKCNPMTSFN